MKLRPINGVPVLFFLVFIILIIASCNTDLVEETSSNTNFEHSILRDLNPENDPEVSSSEDFFQIYKNHFYRFDLFVYAMYNYDAFPNFCRRKTDQRSRRPARSDVCSTL